MTDREKAIVMAYTGAVMLSGDKLGVFYQYVQEKLGHCVMTHELAYQEVQDAIADAARDDFIELAKDNNVPDKNVGKWISVKDRMPEGDNEVITAYKIDDEKAMKKRKGKLFVKTGNWTGYRWISVWDEYKAHAFEEEVLYWMPLPKPPKEGLDDSD